MGLCNPYKTRKTQGLWVCIILIGLEKPKVYVNLFGIGEPIKLLFKGGGKRKTLTLVSLKARKYVVNIRACLDPQF